MKLKAPDNRFVKFEDFGGGLEFVMGFFKV